MNKRYLFSRIIDEAVEQHAVDDVEGIKRWIVKALHRHGLGDSYEPLVRVDKTPRPLTGGLNTIEVGIAPKSAVDRLANIGQRERAGAALERGFRDGLRMRKGVSADEIVEELRADPI